MESRPCGILPSLIVPDVDFTSLGGPLASIPLIRASQTEPFAAAMAGVGERDVPLFERVGLRPDLPHEAPDTLVPEYAVWDFVEQCARRSGDDAFGWDVGLETPIEAIGSFGREIGSAATLRGALRLFLHEVTKHSSHARFSIVPCSEQVWFCRHGIDRIDVGSWHVEQYVLGIMVRLARLALTPEWCPASLLLKQRSLRGRPLPGPLREARMRLGSRVTAIAIPRQALDRPLATGAQPTAALEPIDLDFAASLRRVLEPVLGGDAADLEHAARYAGVTPRTVQRWLQDEGHSFAGLLDEVRRAEALHLLAAPEVSITHIAARLGYADPANFTRAFRRWTGMAPSRYRDR
jgi:AraC-like DNA-binding protein